MNQLECLVYSVGSADEGVCLLLRLGPYRILLDCGLESVAPLVASSVDGTPPVDIVFCSHAHPDSARGLLEFYRAFPDVPICASDLTTQLLPLNWLDEADIPLFCQALPLRSPLELQERLIVQLYPAGHIPGAAAFHLQYCAPERTYSAFYTGDFLLSNSRLVDGLPLEEVRGLKPDVLILEGSYGTVRHPHRRQQENHLAERIHQAIGDRKSILLPLPTIGMGQELLMLLRSHHHFTGQDIDIWVGGSVALGCDLYSEMLPSFPPAVQNFARHQPLFWDERIRPCVRRLPDVITTRSRRNFSADRPCIVLTDVQTDLTQYCREDAGNWLMLIPQYPGRAGEIQGAIAHNIESSHGLKQRIQAGKLAIETYLLGEHCDGPATTQLIHNLRPQHVLFVHGAPNYLNDLAGLEELQNRYQLHTPAAGAIVALPIGETFIQPAPPESRYEGELTEMESEILLVLPDHLKADLRWRSLSDTGVIEARWQGEALVIRGLSQRELLNQSDDHSALQDVECCENCLHFRGQRCWNAQSPLFEFRVTPEGYCPVFERGRSDSR
jgi:Cft2 family RNA processing exonuclease